MKMTDNRRAFLAALGCSLALFTGCATTSSSDNTDSAPASGALNDQTDEALSFEESLYFDEEVVSETEVYDPLEGLNRAIFGFNDFAYRFVLGPIGDGYDTIMPDPAQEGISNFFHNLATPVRGVSSLLQGKIERAHEEVNAFVINSTVGLAGINRPAKESHEPPAEDLGQTLGTWGFGQGPYLVLPLLGPTTLRDGVGRIGAWFLNPIHYVEDDEARLILGITPVINELPENSERYEELREAAVDPYSALRDAYLKSREHAVEE
jgi:phospholipid-binding lipoprotein MlaA